MSRSRFGRPVRTSGVAAPTSASVTAAGVAVGNASRTLAAAPAAWGDAIDVPLTVRVAASPVIQAPVMSTPGATRSTQLPALENGAKPSSRSLAATVRAERIGIVAEGGSKPETVLDALVLDVIFEGDRLVYVVRSEELGAVLRLFDRQPWTHRARSPGDRLRIGWSEQDLIVFPANDKASGGRE